MTALGTKFNKYDFDKFSDLTSTLFFRDVDPGM